MGDPSIEGAYLTRDGMKFTYEVTWTTLDSRIKWNAIVRRDGKEISRPHGEIATASETEVAVKEAVHEFMETAFRLRR